MIVTGQNQGQVKKSKSLVCIHSKVIIFSCGGGVRTRSRKNQMPGQCASLKDFKCPKSLQQTEQCNIGCPNGGEPSERGCQCQPGWSGQCCNTGEPGWSGQCCNTGEPGWAGQCCNTGEPWGVGTML